MSRPRDTTAGEQWPVELRATVERIEAIEARMADRRERREQRAVLVPAGPAHVYRRRSC